MSLFCWFIWLRCLFWLEGKLVFGCSKGFVFWWLRWGFGLLYLLMFIIYMIIVCFGLFKLGVIAGDFGC